MSPFLQFELLMAALYLIESLAWVAGDAVLVVRSVGRRGWGVRPGVGRPWQVFATRRGRVLLAGISPSDVGLLGAPWPVSWHDGRLVNRPAHAMFDDRVTESLPLRSVEIHTIGKVKTLDREIWIGGERFADAVSVEQAQLIAETLGRMRDTAPERREAIGERVTQRMFSERRAGRRWASFQREAVAARWLALALAGFVFIVLPVLYTTVGLAQVWPVLIPVYLGLVGMAAIEAWRLHRRFYPRQRGERWKQAILSFFAPTHAMRLPDHTAHALLSQFHPVVVARVVGSARQAEDAAREAWLSVHFPRNPSDESPVETHARKRLAERLDGWLAERKYPVATWGQLPEPSAVRSVAYCPRCHGQYVEVEGGCRACGGVALVRFKA